MPEETATNEPRPVPRREFLWYVWASSIALFMAGSGGATLAYAYPRFREGEFGRYHRLAALETIVHRHVV